MRIMLVRTLGKDHVYSLFTGQLHQALIGHGVEAEIFHFESNFDDFIIRLAERQYDAIISFSSFLGDATIDDGVSLYDVVGTQFLGWHFDHPTYVSKFISHPISRRRSIYPNINHVRFVEAAGLGGDNTVLLPGANPGDAPIKDFADRSMPVFVAAKWNGPAVRHWEALEDSPARKLIARMVETLLEDREVSVLDSFERTRDDLGYGGLLLNEDVFALIRAAFTYVRHLDRFNAVLDLARSGVPMTVWGSGWEEILSDMGNVRLLPDMTFAQTLPLYGDARIAINLNAGNGGCERATHAMQAGSCIASEFSSTLAGAFSDDEIRFFDRSGPNGIANVVSELLESDRSEHLAAKAMGKAISTMQWSHKAQAVMSLLGQAA